MAIVKKLFIKFTLSFFCTLSLTNADVIFVKNISDSTCTLTLEREKLVIAKINVPVDEKWHEFQLKPINGSFKLFFIHPTPFDSFLHEEANFFEKVSQLTYKPIGNEIKIDVTKQNHLSHYITVVNRVDSDIQYEVCNGPSK